ncbi:hypothetical protein CALCODRAFT_492416 [Calocera cornea HHB12733]|uniref:Uncharacterized protein n=1 Tax=Calocera cornea HHB12733 TaxID=1353952 RepID=A0A165IC04_9BASI|nr:hypothetical protein CALCODRAFT_492416 [Calocera cornea HHB12733]
MAVLCLRRLSAFFLAFVLVTASEEASRSQPTISASVSVEAITPTVSIRATTLYIISESFTYDPTTFSTTIISETILPTTRATHTLDPLTGADDDSASTSATFTPPSPFAAAETPSTQSSGATAILAHSGGVMGVVVAVFTMLL